MIWFELCKKVTRVFIFDKFRSFHILLGEESIKPGPGQTWQLANTFSAKGIGSQLFYYYLQIFRFLFFTVSQLQSINIKIFISLFSIMYIFDYYYYGLLYFILFGSLYLTGHIDGFDLECIRISNIPSYCFMVIDFILI